MSKQDRQGVRRASDLEQKYDFSLLGEFGKNSAKQDERLSQFQQQFTQFMVTINGQIEELSNGFSSQNEALNTLTQQFNQTTESMNGIVEDLSNLEKLVDENTNSMNDLEEKIYPIGSFYVSVNSTDPTELFGGTWEFYTEGHLLIGLEPEENALPKMLQISDKCYVWKRLA